MTSRSITSGRRATSSSSAFGGSCDGAVGPRLSVFSYLRPRTELWVAEQFAALRPVPRRLPQLQPRLPPGPGAASRPLVRHVRQVLLHRPRAGAVHGARRARGDFRGDRATGEPGQRGAVPRAARARRRRPAVRVRRATSTSAGRQCSWRPARVDRAGSRAPARCADEVVRTRRGIRNPTRRHCSRRGGRTTSRSVMRQPISWSALADATVGVWGLGVEGRASSVAWPAMGVRPVLVDDAPAAPDARRARGPGHRVRRARRALLGCDVVVKSPGISRYRPEVARLESAGVAVCGGLGLFMAEADPTRVACITGTKGKSTTTALAVHLLEGPRLRRPGRRQHRAAAVGPPLSGGPDYWIVETSSFQVPDLATAPEVVAVTSLSPDHLDWHGTVERYYADKLSLCTKPGVSLALADGSDDRLAGPGRATGPAPRWVGRQGGGAGHRLVVLARAAPGPHNARNASVARAVLAGLGVAGASDPAALAAAAAGFGGLPSRCRSLGWVGGRRVRRRRPVDERVADAGRAGGIRRPPGRVARRRPRPWRRLRAAGRKTPGAGRRHARGDDARQRAAYRRGSPCSRTAASRWSTHPAWTTRSTAAFAWANPGSVVLLSPAAPSFGRFDDYRARSEAFAAAAARYGALS